MTPVSVDWPSAATELGCSMWALVGNHVLGIRARTVLREVWLIPRVAREQPFLGWRKDLEVHLPLGFSSENDFW